MRDIKQGAWQGKTLAELWPPEQGADLQRMYFQIIATGKPLERVELQELVDGLHHFLAHHFSILDKNGLPYMVGNIAIDVTARQRAGAAGGRDRPLVSGPEPSKRGHPAGAGPGILIPADLPHRGEEGLFRMDSSSL